MVLKKCIQCNDTFNDKDIEKAHRGLGHKIVEVKKRS